MPQNKAAIIISEYEGNKIDWGIITGEGVRAALASFQSGKKLLSVIDSFPHSPLPTPFAFFPSRPFLPTTTTEVEGEDIGNNPGRVGRPHTRVASLDRLKTYHHLGTTPTKDTEAMGAA